MAGRNLEVSASTETGRPDAPRAGSPGRLATVAGLVACLALLPAAHAREAEAWQWSITPYLWASDTSVDLRFRDQDLGSGEIPFDDLLDTIDTAFMVQVEGGRGNWSAFGDLSYLDTSDTTERTLLTVAAENQQTVLDAAVAWWPDGVGAALSFFGGVRYTGFDDRYRFFEADSLVGEQRSRSDYVDLLLGVRYRFDFSERWAFLTHADLSGGDSEGTFLLRGVFAYALGQRRANRLMFGYQYKEAEFEDGDLRTDFSYGGPMLGFDFRF